MILLIDSPLSIAGMIDNMASANKIRRSFEYLEKDFIFKKYLRPVTWASFRKSIIESIRQAFRLSYSVTIGIAIKNGIDLTKNTVAFSIGAMATYIAKI